MNEELKFSEAIDLLRSQKEALTKEVERAINDHGRQSPYAQYLAGRRDQQTVILNALQEISCKLKILA